MAEDHHMTEIVVADRIVPRMLAVVPGAVVAVAVRLMTLGTPPTALRLAAAPVVALACWTAYRLLTVKVTIGQTAVVVRGVFYDAEIGYGDLSAVDHTEPHLVVRAFIWGAMQARAVTLNAAGRKMRPLALLSFAEDMDIDRAVDAMLVRTGACRVPAQRRPSETAVTTR
jgi:hypothetical protein